MWSSSYGWPFTSRAVRRVAHSAAQRARSRPVCCPIETTLPGGGFGNRSVCIGHNERELSPLKLPKAHVPVEVSDALEFSGKILSGIYKTNLEPEFGAYKPYRLCQIRIVGNDNCNIVIAPKSVDQQITCQIYV